MSEIKDVSGESMRHHGWDAAQLVLRDFRQRITDLGPDFAAMAAVTYTGMEVTSVAATPETQLGQAIQLLIAHLEYLRKAFGMSWEDLLLMLANIVQHFAAKQRGPAEPDLLS